ncbi:hypothetical protein [Catellatospora paridis]|uniref:hypothetical protein n=1 Tax=Catellatospora paridis TaxID=1617086 RepID=UPI0012D3F44E|nr:hypothetical protein [Catellatospora paridis]
MLLSVYCSGSIMKGKSDAKKLCWTDTEKDEVRNGAAPSEVVFLNPDDPITDPNNSLGQFGRDMFQVMTATAIIVDARERRGIGIGVEMAAAATFGTPVIVVAPRNTLYRSDVLEYRGTTVSNYVHPHVASLASFLADDFEEAGRFLTQVPVHKEPPVNTPEWLDRAIEEYRENVLPGDEPMLQAMKLLMSTK